MELIASRFFDSFKITGGPVMGERQHLNQLGGDGQESNPGARFKRWPRPIHRSKEAGFSRQGRGASDYF